MSSNTDKKIYYLETFKYYQYEPLKEFFPDSKIKFYNYNHNI